MEVDQVGDHRHQGTRPAALADRLVRDMVEQRMHRKDDIGVVLLQQLAEHLAHAGTEDRADRGKGGLRVARVVQRAPRPA